MLRLLRRRKQQSTTLSSKNEHISEVEEVLDNGYKIIIKTDKPLSDDQKSIIITTIKNGIISNEENSDICIKIMMQTGICDIMEMKVNGNVVELIF